MERNTGRYSTAEIRSRVQNNARKSVIFSEELISESSIKKLRTMMKVEAGYKTALENGWKEENLSDLYDDDPSEFKYALRNPEVINAIKNGEYNPKGGLTPTDLIEHAAENSNEEAKEIVDKMPKLNIPMGVEIECYLREDKQEPSLPDGWVCHLDGSLMFNADYSSVDSNYKNVNPSYRRYIPKEFVSPILENMKDINSLVDVATSIDKNCVASKTKEDSKKKSGLHVHIGIFPSEIHEADGLKDNLPELDRIKQVLLVYSAL